MVFGGTKCPIEYELDVDEKAEIKYDSSQICLKTCSRSLYEVYSFAVNCSRGVE